MIGEHIRTLRGGRWNHAIDCGDETVIHLADEDAGTARVRRSYRPEFVSGAELVQVVTHRERTFPANEVVARAYSRIADPALAAMFRDSEAFAEWCATGRLPAGPPNVAVTAPRAGPAEAASNGPAVNVRAASPALAAEAPAKGPRRKRKPASRRGAARPKPASAKAKGKAKRAARRTRSRKVPRRTARSKARRR